MPKQLFLLMAFITAEELLRGTLVIFRTETQAHDIIQVLCMCPCAYNVFIQTKTAPTGRFIWNFLWTAHRRKTLYHIFNHLTLWCKFTLQKTTECPASQETVVERTITTIVQTTEMEVQDIRHLFQTVYISSHVGTQCNTDRWPTDLYLLSVLNVN
jgi:hypothetical protein